MSSESFENLQPASPKTKPEEQDYEKLTDRVVIEAERRIKKELDERIRKELGDEISGKMINNLRLSALIGLHELVKKYDNPFPHEIMVKAAKKFAEEDPIYNPEKPFSGLETAQENKNPSDKVFDKLVYRPENFTPEEKQEFLENLIVSHPNSLKMMIAENPNEYYTDDLLPEKEDKTDYHTPQPNV